MPVVRILPKIDNHISFFTYLCDYFWKIIYQTDILRCVTATWGGVLTWGGRAGGFGGTGAAGVAPTGVVPGALGVDATAGLAHLW